MSEHISGEQFLHTQHPSLHHSTEVEYVAQYLRANGESIPNDPEAKIYAYLGFLADDMHVNDGIITGDQNSIDRQIEAGIIEDDDVSANRRELVQAEQRESLTSWALYFTDPGADETYPDWFKLYAWDGVRKMGGYQPETKTFAKRSRSTTAPYPECNAEALAYVYDALTLYNLDNQAPHDETLARLAQNGSFAPLYAHALAEVVAPPAELYTITTGSWVTYPQTPRHDDNDVSRSLVRSLRGYGTGWCTAGSVTAGNQLHNGDMHVFYSQDMDGNARVPRIAIRMSGDRIAEVRGIKTGQRLESSMGQAALQKLRELPGGEVYEQHVADMLQLDDIMLRHEAGESLTPDDLTLLYTGNVKTFGHVDDPRVEQLLMGRTLDEDIQIVLAHNDTDELIDNLLHAENKYWIFTEYIDEFIKRSDAATIAGALIDTKNYWNLTTHMPKLAAAVNDPLDLAARVLGKMQEQDHDPVYARMLLESVHYNFDIRSSRQMQQAFLDAALDANVAGVVISNLSLFDSLQLDIQSLVDACLSQDDFITLIYCVNKVSLTPEQEYKLVQGLFVNDLHRSFTDKILTFSNPEARAFVL